MADLTPRQASEPATVPQRTFAFDGGAGSYFLVGIGAFLLTVLTLGFASPWAIAMRYRWKAQHTVISGRRVIFTGTGLGLFGNWIKWELLTIITLGIYSFWVIPRLTRWIVEHEELASDWARLHLL